MLKTIATRQLEIAYDEQGDADGWPVVLLHGFPYDIQSFEEVAPQLVSQGARVITPFLRGYGPTRFVDETIPRSGQQAALGADLLALLDALNIEQAVVGGYDWGGRAACIVAALYPSRVRGLVSVNGYNIQDIAASVQPASPEKEYRLWYQYYFHGERGRAGLTENRHKFCKLLWSLWSPTWRFDENTYARSAAAFDNPDFVDVVIHSYRHRFGLADGDPLFDDMERRLASAPAISVPTITLEGDADGVTPVAEGQANLTRFTGRHENRIIPNAGHNLAQEAPDAFAAAVLDINDWAG
ncbi:putative epoxide hydrolase [Advenella kashmirensis WT001]|uniref:Putative epoxide hydrolase n=1 Tax=Advenella kashmirensis (strain DSM 17095 / LMG 22695 / WT001) TaxID=1036672 RepID=I3UG14_ADVKW|nr:alpha/beta hydrolase [Advenella kashmirensis]AFK63952.1 putative epoxide hydrolase [Advenella kashmirensis WT001]